MQHSKRRLSPSFFLAGAFLMLAFSWALAASASAAVPGLVSAPNGLSERNSQGERSAVAECPSGKRVVGMGASIAGGAGEVVIDGIVPTSDLKRVEVTAREDQDGTIANWRLIAMARCADPIPGMNLRSDTVDLNNSDNKSSTARCDFGQRVLGVGAELIGGNGQVKLDQLNPSSTSGFAFAREDRDGFANNWRVVSHVICAKPMGQQIVRALALGTGPNVSITARCAFPGTTVSGGFDSVLFSSTSGEAVVGAFNLSAGGVSVQSKPDQPGAVINRGVEAVAVCA